MKKVLVLLVFVAIAMAVNTQVQTILPALEDKVIENQNTSRVVRPNEAPSEMPIIGRQEIVGYTDYDWQFNGPNYKMCIVDPVANGIHVCWMYRLGTDPRNMRYNFYDFSTNSWNWPDGINVYTLSTGFGGMDNDPITGNAVICAHGTVGSLIPIIARDLAPGAGLFEYSNGPLTYLWPPVAVTYDQTIHVAMIANDAAALRDTLYYVRMPSWNSWGTPILMHDASAMPNFPTQNIAASKTSNKVIVLWECSEDPFPERAFYRLSTNSGVTWGPQTQIPFPPSYGGVTPSYYISSLYAIFDNSDNLRIVASVSHTSGGSLFTIPAQIWLYSPANAQPWTLVHHYDAETLAAAVGYNATFATRPTIVQADNGNFYVAWEQFDTLNYEVTTNLARADIYVAEITNNGQTVSRKGRITDPNTTSKRFPSIGGVKNDTIILSYMVDSVAGFIIQGQGRLTNNPIVVHRLHRNSLPPTAIEENSSNRYYNFALKPAVPNPSRSHTTIHYSLPSVSNIDLTIYDILGRPIRTLFSGSKTAGEYSAIWDGRTDTGKKAEAGIYFYTLKTSDKSISQKVVRTN